MAVKVLITRQFKAGMTDEAFKLLTEVRSKVTLKPGYISGQTLVSADKPNKLIVVSTWTGRKQWEAWRADESRKELSNKIEPLLEGPEQIEVFYTGRPAED